MYDYLIIFTMGLFGALHCVGMCGGLIGACAMRCGGGAGFTLRYNAGRVLTYTALGAALGLAGGAFAHTGWFAGLRDWVPVIAGAFMILIGLDLLGVLPGRNGRGPVFLPAHVLDRIFGKKTPPALLLGMANGLVPCGLVYAAGVKAASTGDPASGALVMAALGAGTFVPMLAVGTLAALASRRGPAGSMRARAFTAASSIVVMALGVKTMVGGIMGMGMGGGGHMHMPM